MLLTSLETTYFKSKSKTRMLFSELLFNQVLELQCKKKKKKKKHKVLEEINIENIINYLKIQKCY